MPVRRPRDLSKRVKRHPNVESIDLDTLTAVVVAPIICMHVRDTNLEQGRNLHITPSSSNVRMGWHDVLRVNDNGKTMLSQHSNPAGWC